MGLCGDIDMRSFLGEKVDKKKEDKFDSFKNPNTDTFHPASSVSQTVFGQHSACSQQSGKDSRRKGFDPGIDFQESRQNSFWEDGHVSNGTLGDVDLSGLLARKSGEENRDGIEKLEKRETKMSRQTSQRSADCRAEMSEAETCSDGPEVTNYPGVQKETSSESAQRPANLSLQETSGGMFQMHSQVDCIRKETM